MMRRPQLQNLQRLVAALEDEWDNIPGHGIGRYISSMRRRCVAVYWMQEAVIHDNDL